MNLDELTKIAAMNQLISEWNRLEDSSKELVKTMAIDCDDELKQFIKQLYIILSVIKS